MKLLDTLLQVSNSTRRISLFCRWCNNELQIVTERNKKPVCYHQNIGIDQNTEQNSKRTASWQFAIMQWEMFSVDVLYAFVLKCTEREKPWVWESPSSVVITNKQFVSNSNWVTRLRLWPTDAEVELNSHPLASPFPSRLRHLSHGHIPFFLQQSLLTSPLPLPCVGSSAGLGKEQGAEGGTRAGKPPVKKRDVAKLPSVVNHGALSAHLFPEHPG